MRAGTSDGGRLQAILDSPGQAPVVGVIAPQLKKHHQTAERNRRSGGKEKELTERKKNNKPDRKSTILKEEKLSAEY
jgi:hypothetical protein